MFSDTDITEFIRVQREKINSQKRYYEDFVDRLSKLDTNVHDNVNHSDKSSEVSCRRTSNLELLKSNIEQRTAKNNISPSFKNKHIASQFMFSDSSSCSTHSLFDRETFIPGIGIVQDGSNRDVIKLQREIYRKELDKQVEENQRIKNQKEEAVDENRFKKDVESNGLLFSNSSDELKLRRHHYRILAELNLSREMEQRNKTSEPDNTDNSPKKSQSPKNVDARPVVNECSLNCKSPCSYLAHGGEIYRVGEADLQMCRRISQELYRTELDKQIKEKNKLLKEEQERSKKEDEKLQKYIDEHTVRFANRNEEHCMKKNEQNERIMPVNLKNKDQKESFESSSVRTNKNDERKENRSPSRHRNADFSKHILSRRLQEEKLLENLSNMHNKIDDGRKEQQNATVNYYTSRRHVPKNFVINTTDHNYFSEERTKTIVMPNGVNVDTSKILIDAPHKLSMLGPASVDNVNTDDDNDFGDRRLENDNNKSPPSPVISAVRTRNLLENFSHLTRVPPGVSFSDNARSEYEKHVLANLSQIRRQLMQNTSRPR